MKVEDIRTRAFLTRDRGDRTDSAAVVVDLEVAEALLEVADAARVHLDRLTPTSRAGLIAALVRLDGE